MTRSCDVVVIGSGAGGAPVALALAEAGVDVVIVERGPRYTQADFVHDELRVARRDFFVPSARTDPHIVVSGGGEPERTNEGWVASCVGGGTVHMSGFFYRFAAADFRVREILGAIAGAEHANWPISYEEMVPYYAQVEATMGISGPADEGPHAPPRQSPYSMPAVNTHPAAVLLDEAAKALGVHAFKTPRAIITRPFAQRQACVYCGLCGGFGCEVGAKSSTLDSLIPQAEATGHCQVLAETMVTHIERRLDGRASGVVVRSLARGEDGSADERIAAKAVVVACSAVESARLLLLSDLNDNGQVGRHLMFSTLAKAHGSFRLGKNATRDDLLRPSSAFLGRSVLDYYMGGKGSALKKAGALNFLFPSGGPISQSEMVAAGHFAPALQHPGGGLKAGEVLWGPALKKALRHYWHEQRQLDCEGFGEYLPTPGTRVELDPQVKDRFGLPVARILIDRHPHDAEVSGFLADRAAELLEAAGADSVWRSSIGGRTMHLPMGCLRMGEDKDTSVVDRDGRLHFSSNVFATDGAVFPSSGGVPPTFTILANSFRTGAAMLAAAKALQI